MSSRLHFVALAVLIGALASAHATPITIHFDRLPLQPDGCEQITSDQYKTDGLIFIAGLIGPPPTAGFLPAVCAFSGDSPPWFVTDSNGVDHHDLLGTDNVSFGSFSITVDKNKYRGFSVKEVQLDYFADKGLQVIAFDSESKNKPTLGSIVAPIPHAWQDQQRLGLPTIPESDTADTLTIQVSGLQPFAYIDNLTLDLIPLSGTAPEPTGIGLVALALGAAGFASRRRIA